MAPDMDTDDILSDVGVKVWKALIKVEYLKKPKGELIKIAYVTARRHIAGLIRTRMGPISRGEAVAFVPFHNDNVSNAASLLLGKDYDRMAEISKILVFESIQNEAINLVGINKHRFLLQAIEYEWLREDMSPEQCAILSRLDYSQLELMRLLSILANRVLAKLRSEEDTDSQPSKIDGVWVQNTESTRRVLS
jgi:hypothetical protein